MTETPEQFMLRFAATLRSTASLLATKRAAAEVMVLYRQGFEDGIKVAADTLEAVALSRMS